MAMLNESESVPNPKESVNKDEFDNWLISKVSRQSTMVSRAFGEKVIQYLREERENGPNSPVVKAKHNSSFRFQVRKRKFQLINVVGLGDILCLPLKDQTQSKHAMLGQHRQVIFKEDMYQVIHSAHVNGERHRGYKGTFKKINATYCNIPREVVSKFVAMCKFCRKAHACFAPSKHAGNRNKQLKRKELLQKKTEIEMSFMTRCQVDILDMQSFPDSDGGFFYILHFLDMHTKYNVLIPLKRTDAFYVSRKLCRYVFGHFGLPRIIHSNLGRKYADDVISWILQLWSTDAQILNGNPRYKKVNAVIEQRQKTIMMLIETIRGKQTDVSNWSSLLPGIQYSLNTNQFEVESQPSYYLVYSRRPKVYTYAPSSKNIPREEDVVEEEPGDETATGNVNEVITVSMSDLLQNGSAGNTILISQLQPPSSNANDLNREDKHLSSSDAIGLKNGVIQSHLMNPSTIDSLPLTLTGDQQYTIISTNLGVNGQAIQIPVVNLGNTSLSIQTDACVSMDETKMRTVDTRNALRLHSGETITLSDSNREDLGLAHPNRDHLNLNNHQTLNLTNQDDIGLSDETRNSLGLNEENEATLSLDSQDDSALGLNSLETEHVTGSLEIPNLKMEEVLRSNDADDEGVTDNACFNSKQSPNFTMTSLQGDMNTSPDEHTY